MFQVVLVASLVGVASAGFINQMGVYMEPRHNGYGTYTNPSYNFMIPTTESHFLNALTHKCAINSPNFDDVSITYTDNLETSKALFKVSTRPLYPFPAINLIPTFLKCTANIYDDSRRGLANTIEIWANIRPFSKDNLFLTPSLFSVGGAHGSVGSLSIVRDASGFFAVEAIRKDGVADSLTVSKVPWFGFNGQVVLSFNYDKTVSLYLNGVLALRSTWSYLVLTRDVTDFLTVDLGSDGFAGELYSVNTWQGAVNIQDVQHKLSFGVYFPAMGYFDNTNNKTGTGTGPSNYPLPM